MSQLHILLEGPFAICDDNDSVCILVPDLLDSHYKPGLVASNNEAELENGVWALTFGSATTKKAKTGVRVPLKGKPIDQVPCTRTSNSEAYAVLVVPRPDYIYGTMPTSASVGPHTLPGEPNPPYPDQYSTRATLVYNSVDLSTLAIDNVDFNPGQKPDVADIGGVGLLVFEMLPIGVADDNHARMAYRSMARLIGVNRFMYPPPPANSMHLLHAKYDDCRAAVMVVTPAPSQPTKTHRKV